MTLKQFIEKYEISQSEMARRLDISLAHFRMLMLGQTAPSRKLAIRIEKITGGAITKEEAIFNFDKV